MKFITISLQSIRRKKAKSFFLSAGIILAVGSVVTLVTVSKNVNDNVASNLDEFGANIIITPKSDEINLRYAGINIVGTSYENNGLTRGDLVKIKQIKNKDNLSIISPKLLNITKIDGKSVIIGGVNFAEELRLKKWWKIKGGYPAEKNEIVIGSEAAKQFNKSVGSKLIVNNKTYNITGVLEELGSQDDGIIFMDIEESGKLFNKTDKISFIEIAALCYDCPIEEIVSQTSYKLPGAKVTAIKQAIESKMAAIHSFESFAIGISIVILLISILIIFVNVNASVTERIKEIGIFKAIGFRNYHILKIILYEVSIVSVISGTIGYLISMPVAKLITPLLTPDPIKTVIFNYHYFPIALFLSLVVGILAALYPAIRAAKLDPTVAFRAL